MRSARASKLRCWIAPGDILPGADWGESIVKAIRASRVMVLVFSSHANASRQVRREVQSAFDKEVPVIPFVSSTWTRSMRSNTLVA
jgi:hypothetical protein